MSLARRVRDCRFAKGWGPDELAHRASISRTALYQIESGKTELPRASTLRRIAQALDVPMELLLKDVDEGHAPARREGGPSDAALLAWEEEVTERLPASGFDRLGLRRNGNGHDLGHGSRGRPLARETHEADLERKFREVLESPLGEGIARIVEESHRLLASGASRTVG